MSTPIEEIKTLADQIFEQYKSSILQALTTNKPDLIAAGMSYIAKAEQRLKDEAVAAINGDLDYAFVVRRLKEEETTLKDALIGIEQMLAADIQVLINNLVMIFENLLKSAILSLIPAA